MKIVQILPNLDSGGVERGTVDFARELVARQHQSIVISNGGRLQTQLEQEGSQHIHFPVHKKSLSSLFKVRALRDLLVSLDADIVHVRSRVPAWMTWLAIKNLPKGVRPGLVSTFHGLYSTNAYSEVMGCGDQVVAISQCVKDYINLNYPKIDDSKITIVPRGVDIQEFDSSKEPEAQWRDDFFQQNPQCKDKPIILMPARLSRWKGQPEFIDLISDLVEQGNEVHGLIVGEPTPGKEKYYQQLKDQVSANKLDQHISFLGHRNDMFNMYSIASIICNLSTHPEPFGRTVIESLAMQVPVLAYDCGGPSESMADCLPSGLVETNNRQQLVTQAQAFLQQKPVFTLPHEFTLTAQADSTLAIYQKVLDGNKA